MTDWKNWNTNPPKPGDHIILLADDGCSRLHGAASEYVRADLVEAMEAERARAEKAEAERDKALARLAAVHREAIERCAALLIELGYVSESGETLAYEVRGLRVAPDAQAALDKLLAEARLEGWRAGRDAAAQEAEDWFYDPQADEVTDARLSLSIRALPEPKEASHV